MSRILTHDVSGREHAATPNQGHARPTPPPTSVAAGKSNTASQSPATATTAATATLHSSTQTTGTASTAPSTALTKLNGSTGAPTNEDGPSTKTELQTAILPPSKPAPSTTPTPSSTAKLAAADPTSDVSLDSHRNGESATVIAKAPLVPVTTAVSTAAAHQPALGNSHWAVRDIPSVTMQIPALYSEKTNAVLPQPTPAKDNSSTSKPKASTSTTATTPATDSSAAATPSKPPTTTAEPILLAAAENAVFTFDQYTSFLRGLENLGKATNLHDGINDNFQDTGFDIDSQYNKPKQNSMDTPSVFNDGCYLIPDGSNDTQCLFRYYGSMANHRTEEFDLNDKSDFNQYVKFQTQNSIQATSVATAQMDIGFNKLKSDNQNSFLRSRISRVDLGYVKMTSKGLNVLKTNIKALVLSQGLPVDEKAAVAADSPWQHFFEQYGTHVTIGAKLGAFREMRFSADTDEGLNSNEFKAAAKLEIQAVQGRVGVSTDTSIDKGKSESTSSSRTTMEISYRGGHPDTQIKAPMSRVIQYIQWHVWEEYELVKRYPEVLSYYYASISELLDAPYNVPAQKAFDKYMSDRLIPTTEQYTLSPTVTFEGPGPIAGTDLDITKDSRLNTMLSEVLFQANIELSQNIAESTILQNIANRLEQKLLDIFKDQHHHFLVLVTQTQAAHCTNTNDPLLVAVVDTGRGYIVISYKPHNTSILTEILGKPQNK